MSHLYTHILKDKQEISLSIICFVKFNMILYLCLHTVKWLQLLQFDAIKVWSPDGDSDYFSIVAGVLQGDTLAPYLFIICVDYALITSIDKIKENRFKLTKERSRMYLTKTIIDADYADDIELLANAPAQTKTLLHSLERASAGISLNVNAH